MTFSALAVAGALLALERACYVWIGRWPPSFAGAMLEEHAVVA